MDPVFAALLMSLWPMLCGGAHYVPHGWRPVTPCIYLLDRRAIRCTRAQCAGAIVTADDSGVVVVPFDRHLHPRCTMTLTTAGLTGCDALRNRRPAP